MKKRFFTLLLSLSMIATLLTGCGGSKLFSNALTAQEFLSHAYVDENGELLYATDFPEDKWNVDEEGNKYIAITIDNENIEGYLFYENGDIAIVNTKGEMSQNDVATTSDIKDLNLYNMETMVSYLTNWGENNEGLNSANEKVLSMDEFNSLYNTIDITTDNVNDYFNFVPVDYEGEITGSNFEDEHFYYPEKEIRLMCTPDNIVTNKDSEVVVKVDFSYSTVRYKVTPDNLSEKFDEYTYDPTSDSWEWNIYSYNLKPSDYYNSIPVISANFSSEDNIIYVSERTYDSYGISKAQGTIHTFNEPDDTMWNTSPSGISYLAVRDKDNNIVRLTKTGLTCSYIYNGLEVSLEEQLSNFINSYGEEKLNPADYWNYWSMYYFE